VGQPRPGFPFTDVLDILESSPARLAVAATGRTDDALHEPLESGGWSARDILGHLRACQRTWTGYLERILDEDHPSYRYESPRSTIRRTDFLTLSYGVSLERFAADRERLVARLRSIDPADLERTASVTVSGGRVQQHTAFSYVHRMAAHEREHVDHIERAMATELSHRLGSRDDRHTDAPPDR
jgi:hypothetical protein